MASKQPKIRVSPQTYAEIVKLAEEWNVSLRQVVDFCVRHVMTCNRIGIPIARPLPELPRQQESAEPTLWWNMCADCLWVGEAIVNALLRLADIYPDLKADWQQCPYEAKRRLDIVLREWGVLPAEEAPEETTQEPEAQATEPEKP